ncbi:MAG: PD40 domain-containing protein [Acidobacteria bacterium]|nr:PD40 domain-containing protein [Acidobacteriota bacterium]
MNRFLAPALLLAATLCLAESSARPLLLQKPALSKTHIVFAYAGDLWRVSREGGDAVRLTSGAGIETTPFFSPDGSKIAFTGEYDGNVDVYVMPAEGGVPRRLTHHPGPDNAAGWTPDGSRILFRSTRDSYSRFARLYTVPVDGGFPTPVDLPMAEMGAFSPDGKRLAYLPLSPAFTAWKRYRGGQTTPIWIADLGDGHVERIPRDNSNDYCPMWAGDRVYFLSDRDGPFTLYSFDTRTRQVRQLVRNTGLDIKWASAGPGAIVYEQFGAIHVYDLQSGKARPVDIRVSGDVPAARPSIEKVGARIGHAALSPTGRRAVFEARGEIFTAPVEKGDVRNLTNTPGVAERSPAWSPDGKQIAYFSDESGEYALHIRPQEGSGEVRKIALPPGFYWSLEWSPDSKKVAFIDGFLTLWCLELEKAAPVKVARDTYDSVSRDLDPAWSPDSKWIAYTRLLKNHLRAVFLYSLEAAKSHQISDGLSDAGHSGFDKNGKYLYFTASTNLGLSTAWLDMSSLDHAATRSVYVAVLSKDDPSPLAPESDEETSEAKKPDKPAGKSETAPVVKIDLDGIDQRILALPIPARDYTAMKTGESGVLFLLESTRTLYSPPGPFAGVLHKFELKSRKTERVVDGVRLFEVSHDGKKALYRLGDRWAIAAAGAAPKPGEGVLKTDSLEMRADPGAEWKQMYREVWRIQRDFFYDPNAHGLDLRMAARKYEPYLAGIAHREDLNYLFVEMLGEMSVGHMRAGGGALPDVKRVGVGLLGADYKLENGRYRFARVYSGENWNPQTRAPLTQPGVNVTAGEYLLAVNGRELRATDEIYAFFEATAGKSVILRVGPDAGGANARDVTVVPAAEEFSLRSLSWIAGNRRKVDQLTGGRVAYVYLPNTTVAGYVNFNRYYFAQVGKEAAVIDERFNGGGQVAEYIIDYLNRPLLSYWTTRTGEDFTTPQNSIYGPKVMIINEMAGSGGDALPWMFRQRKLGTLVGKRTWGGLVGTIGSPQLIDGGFVSAPNLAFWSPKGEWDVENRGVAPDVEVELDPAAWRAGRDPQLEKAVEIALAELEKNPLPKHHRPEFPNYHKAAGQVSGQP